jgi:hypothetical protein
MHKEGDFLTMAILGSIERERKGDQSSRWRKGVHDERIFSIVGD